MKLYAKSLPARILAYFASNPEEELTIEQVAVKLQANLGTVRNALATLVQHGAIENVRIIRLPARGRAQHVIEGEHF